jgi:glucose-1-phosphate cytidylyltransferase
MTKVVLLCGGKGTRLGEVTAGLIPKPMVRIGGKPILWHLMDSFASQGFSEFVLCAGHLSEVIKHYFTNLRSFSSDIRAETGSGAVSYLTKSMNNWIVTVAETGEETMTAGRLVQASKYLGEEPFILTYGDGLANVNITSLLAFHASHGKLATITGVVPPGRFGELGLKGDQVVQMLEKPEQSDRYINGGFMVLNRQFVDTYCNVENANGLMLERAPLERAAKDGELMVFRHKGFWQCMDTARDWELLNELAQQKSLPWK